MTNNKIAAPSMPLDMERFNIVTEGKSTYQEELLTLFFYNSADCLAVMERNYPGQDGQKWAAAAKELKNLSENIGAQELYKICAIAETLGVIADEDTKKILDAIKIHLQRLRAFIRNTRY